MEDEADDDSDGNDDSDNDDFIGNRRFKFIFLFSKSPFLLIVKMRGEDDEKTSFLLIHDLSFCLM